ncbi:hypothetical protein [Sulfurospirillum arcachonense]|uniref:hypothetical protein n=1 Tax=Sulfurospirillum arcachonense TaxID=57666 RepID=UPI0004695AE7|nr:hypothetical protein [Sulfurospirillum arcachonense]
MYIQNHSISMNSQYFNLAADSIEAQIQNSTNTNSSSKEVQKTDINKIKQELALHELNAKLSSSILKNLNNVSMQSIGEDVEITRTHTEAQALNFQTQAFIQSKDREIEISLDISLSRSFVYQTKTTLATEALKDPLIISLNTDLPMLSSHKFEFDIDSDGTSDQISALKHNSGFLALDNNKNGKIDDGSELFGTKSGNGFEDLATFDDDKNGWIDENDKIFDRLQVWMKTQNKDKLVSIGELGIGAIYLGNTQTPFDIKTQTNELLGEVKKSGFFLFENGKAGVVSQVDLAVQSKETLEKADATTQDISKLMAKNIYTDKSNTTNHSNNDLLSKLEAMVKKLQSKLAYASSDAKGSIQTQIATIQAQIVALLMD